jgi:hypothetical protein
MTTAREHFMNVSTPAFNFEDENSFFESSGWRNQPYSLALFHASLHW